jgi:hypothetical protein
MNNIILKEQRLFFTPVYETTIDLQTFNLEHFLSKLEFIPRKFASGLQTTNFTVLEHNDLDDIFTYLRLLVDEISNIWGIDRKLKLTNYWINLDKKHSYMNPHYHTEGIISGVVYLKVPKNCGPIVFERPDIQEHYFEADQPTEYSFKNFSVNPKKNTVLLFPSYIKHRVEQNLTDDVDDQRISLSFNYK